MRIYCWFCMKSVSTELSQDAEFRAVAICPECVEAKKVIFPDDDKKESK